jgi:hypothetical protein
MYPELRGFGFLDNGESIILHCFYILCLGSSRSLLSYVP